MKEIVGLDKLIKKVLDSKTLYERQMAMVECLDANGIPWEIAHGGHLGIQVPEGQPVIEAGEYAMAMKMYLDTYKN